MFALAPLVLAAVVGSSANGSPTAYSASSPVRVSSCKIDSSYDYTGGDVVLRMLNARYLDVKFKNVSQTPLSSVAFRLTDGRSTKTVVATGMFSPGVTIARTQFSPFTTDGHNLMCSVSHVDFTDGGMWMTAMGQ
jgi:hypothetical protein